ncbi:MAG: CHAT domain-containing protein [Alphaproteobacteria bacterium]
MPSIGTLKALRQRGPARSRRRPFAAFGNPVFDGASPDARMPDITEMPASVELDVRRWGSRHQDPLLASEDELLALASLVQVDRRDIFLRDRANETMLERLDLNAYQTLAFGTHVVIPDDGRPAIAEPALLLRVSDRINSDDDGILTESEIARLNVAADLVMLSICRKSGPPSRPGGEALSELARAFLLAGAHALLVGHWGSERDAMRALTERTMVFLGHHPAAGRAAALRRAMIDMIETAPDVRYSHPALWAAFKIVGDGRG